MNIGDSFEVTLPNKEEYDELMGSASDETKDDTSLTATISLIRVGSLKSGSTIKKGECMMIVVAMKMEVKVTAPFDLRIESVTVDKSDKVEEGSLVAKVTKCI
jgi:pyruvate carboxylase